MCQPCTQWTGAKIQNRIALGVVKRGRIRPSQDPSPHSIIHTFNFSHVYLTASLILPAIKGGDCLLILHTALQVPLGGWEMENFGRAHVLHACVCEEQESLANLFTSYHLPCPCLSCAAVHLRSQCEMHRTPVNSYTSPKHKGRSCAMASCCLLRIFRPFQASM